MNSEEIRSLNGVKDSRDVFFLTRNLSLIPRCHTLNMARRPSVGEHVLNLMFMVDYFYHHELINPKPHKEFIQEVKDYLQYHDIEETLVGDIPFYVSREIGTFPEDVRDNLAKEFGKTGNVLSIVKSLALQFDMLDFYLSVKYDRQTNELSYDGERLMICLGNARDMLSRYKEAALELGGYWIQYEGF